MVSRRKHFPLRTGLQHSKRLETKATARLEAKLELKKAGGLDLSAHRLGEKTETVMQFEPANPSLPRQAHPAGGLGDTQLTAAFKRAGIEPPVFDFSDQPRLTQLGKRLQYTATANESVLSAGERAKRLAQVSGEVQFLHPKLQGLVTTDGHRFFQSAGDSIQFPLDELATQAHATAQTFGHPINLKHRVLQGAELSVDTKGTIWGHHPENGFFKETIQRLEATALKDLDEQPIHFQHPRFFGGHEVLIHGDGPITLDTTAKAAGGLRAALTAAGDAPMLAGRQLKLTVDDEPFLLSAHPVRDVPLVTRLAKPGESLADAVLRLIDIGQETPGIVHLSHPQLKGDLSIWDGGLTLESGSPMPAALSQTWALSHVAEKTVTLVPAGFRSLKVLMSPEGEVSTQGRGGASKADILREAGVAAEALNLTLPLERQHFEFGTATVDPSKKMTLTISTNDDLGFASAIRVAVRAAAAHRDPDVKVVIDGETLSAGWDGAIELPELRRVNLEKSHYDQALELANRSQLPVRVPGSAEIIRDMGRAVIYPGGTVAIEQMSGATSLLIDGRPIATRIADRIGHDVELRGADFKPGDATIVVHPGGATSITPARE